MIPDDDNANENSYRPRTACMTPTTPKRTATR